MTTRFPAHAEPPLLDRLRARRLVAVVRGSDPEGALRTVLALAEEGVDLVEVSLTTADALGVLRAAAAELRGADAFLGAGSVLTGEHVRAAAEAGARWMVTPGGTDAVRAAVDAGLPVLAGALTPTEALAATAAGAAAVKLFPASLGGPALLRALREPLPHIPFVPVGGVTEDSARAYLAAGAVAVGVGSPLVGDAAAGGDVAALRARARAFLTACRPPARTDADAGGGSGGSGGAGDPRPGGAGGGGPR
jgi:2-dehydro-3-deoxyphosphogluconate aldolase/(4S)-4-hydroxy-2-oxoglutarate aldolase